MAKKLTPEQVDGYLETATTNELLHHERKISKILSERKKAAEQTQSDAAREIELITNGGKQ